MRTYRARPYRDKKRPHLKFVVNYQAETESARDHSSKPRRLHKHFAQLKNNELLIGETDGAKQLAAFGKTIADAIEFYLPHLQASNRTCTFRELVD